MWDDFKIGQGDSGNMANSIDVEDNGYSISQNSVSYWISDLILGLGGRIMKDTDEGREIAVFVENKDFKGLGKRLNNIALKHITTRKLIKEIDNFGKKKFRDGRESLKKDLFTLLVGEWRTEQ